MSARDDILRANAEFARTFEWGGLGAPPSRRLSVVTCMDARLDPLRLLGLRPGEAHIIRNAGGLVTDDALRSLVISRTLLATQEAFVIGHTDCGMVTFTNDQIRGKLRDELGAEAAHVDFQPFPDAGERVAASVRRIRESNLVPDDYRVTGFVYDVKTGRIDEVEV